MKRTYDMTPEEELAHCKLTLKRAEKGKHLLAATFLKSRITELKLKMKEPKS